MIRRALLCALLLLIGPVWSWAETLDAKRLVEGRWRLEGHQTNDIGTPDEHRYTYSYKKSLALRDGTLYVDGSEYAEARVSGDVIEATYRRDDEWETTRIRFVDRDTVEFTRKGENSAFGVFSVTANGTRITD